MEDAKSSDEDDNFFDAFDEFTFYDCAETFESSDISSFLPQSTHQYSKIDEIIDGKSSDLDTLAESTSTIDDVSSVFADNSVVTMEEISLESNEEGEIDDGQFRLLGFITELLIKSIGFQFNLLIILLRFPFSALYYGLMIYMNPFYVIGLGRSYLIKRLIGLCFKDHKSWINIGFQIGWGLLWCCYVCSVLVSMLVLAFVVGGLMMRLYVVEEPFQLKQPLNFDYTKSKPQALVSITSCRSDEYGEKVNEVSVGGSGRVILPNHKLQATVTLVVPESDYNRNLGIFQVRVDFLSENGKSLASISHPCMLGFRSEPLRLFLTFFKIIPLVAGYVSETQTLTLKFRGYTESLVPTGCLKVAIEQRAEFGTGGGIPEVYDAFIHVESELGFLKRILWSWRKTIFVWLSMMLFVLELLFTVLCCTPLILPRARRRTSGNATQNDSPATLDTY
ncbi:seipin-2-like [Silene latifolia]|uniref:seipin-2-like n=1 Tax=Silene latifolia TaxID=37657 RepID=UPI003D76BAB6